MIKFDQFLKEANKSGDSSLHDWFSKSKSSDGKAGWVQLGGRYAGKSCAKQPGQTTKPKCGSSKMAANMSDKEEDAAARRKRAQDPDPNRSGKPINVPTEGKRKMKESLDEYIAKGECPECGDVMISENELTEVKDACYHKVKSRYSVFPSAYASGALVKCRKAGAANWGNKTKKEEVEHKSFKDFVTEAGRCWAGYKPVKGKKAFTPGSCVKEAANAAQQAAIAVNMKKKGITPKNEEIEQIDESEAWQRKEGQNSEGGLNRKGIQSYRAAHPGSKLSMAVTTKPSKLKAGSKAANRRKSFCARMGGMKRRLTSAKTARDPDSRINKALRKWNC
jgi:hypothetical protein